MTIIPIGIEDPDFGLERRERSSDALNQLSVIGQKVFDASKVAIWNLVHSPQVGKNGNTELMLAIGRNDLVRARELVLDGADPKVKNDGGLDALDFLKYQDTFFTKDKIKLCALLLVKKGMKQRVKEYLSDRLLPQAQATHVKINEKAKMIGERNRVLDQPLPLMIADAVKSFSPLSKKRQSDFNQTLREMFNNMAKIPELVPLLKITGYAIHKCFSKSRKELTLMCDPERKKVKTKDQRSVYGFYSPERHAIEFGGKSRINAESTLIHEITHFVAKMVFDNDCYPYYFNPYTYFFEEETVKSLLQDLKRMKSQSLLPLSFISLFKSSIYPQSERSKELVARISEMLLSGFMRVEVSPHVPSDEEIENSTSVILYNSRADGSEEEELRYAYMDKEESRIRSGKFIIDEPDLQFFKQEDWGSTVATNHEMHYLRLLLEEEKINAASDEFIDGMQIRLIDYYKSNFLPECEKYIKAIRLKKCLFR